MDRTRRLTGGKIRVLFVLRMLGFGGAERQVVELCRAIDKERFDVTVALFFHSEGYWDDLKQTGVRVRVLCQGKDYLWKAVPRLVRLVKEEGFDIVNCFLPIANFLGGLGAKLGGAQRVICALRNADPFSWLSPFCWMDLFAFHFLSGVVTANSVTVKEWAHSRYHVPYNKLFLIPNGRDPLSAADEGAVARLRREFRIESGCRVILSVGRVAAQKGHVDLVRAAGILAREGKSFRVLVAGKFEESAKDVVHLIEAEGLSEHIQLLGVREDVSALMALADVFVLPSLWEGMSNVLLEAMAAGTPSVATDIEANRELVSDGKEALLVRPKDPLLLAQAIGRVLEDRELAGSLGTSACLRSHDFTVSAMAKRYEDLYQQLVNG